MDSPWSFTEAPWPVLRNLTTTVLDLQRPHSCLGFGTANVTLTMERLRACRQATRRAVSLHAYVMYCVARAAREHPAVLTYRHGRRLITFDTVDVGTALQKRMPDGTNLPVVWVLRDADRKSLAQIQHEFREAVRSDLVDDAVVRKRRRLARWPGWLRRWILRRALNNPFRLRELYGNVQLTNLQLPVRFPFAGFPPQFGTLTLAAGTVAPGFLPDAQGNPVLAQLMHVSGAIDHDVLDGMPVVAFARRLHELLETAAGLDDAYIAETLQLEPLKREARPQPELTQPELTQPELTQPAGPRETAPPA